MYSGLAARGDAAAVDDEIGTLFLLLALAAAAAAPVAAATALADAEARPNRRNALRGSSGGGGKGTVRCWPRQLGRCRVEQEDVAREAEARWLFHASA